MKNKCFAKHEILVIIALILSITSVLMGIILKGVSTQRVNVMKRDASSFLKAVLTNMDTFHDSRAVYLDEVIEEKLLPDGIKSPFSRSDCNNEESKVEVVNGKSYVTLRCDSYLIDKAQIIDYDSIDIYKVDRWKEDKMDTNYQKKTMYNCKENGKEIYDHYYEELYFISKINADNGTNYYSLQEIEDICHVVHKKFYRKKKLYN